MTNCKDVNYCVIEMMNKYKLQIKEKDKAKITNILSAYVDMLIFNIVAVTCVICLHIGVKRLMKEHVEHLIGYINKRCALKRKYSNQLMSGGAFNTAAFYGVHEPQYSERNAGTDVMNVDWNNNIARPMLASTMTGGAKRHCDKLNRIIFKKISDVFKFFKVHANKTIRQEFVNMFNKYVHELFSIIALSKKELTAEKLKTILKKSKLLQKK